MFFNAIFLLAKAKSAKHSDFHAGTQTKQNDIMHELQRHKAHIAAIREKHIPNDLEFARNGCIENLESANNAQMGMYDRGVAILLHADMKQHIQHIERIGHRITKLTIATQNSPIAMEIVVTYAPRKGYKQETRNRHWQQVAQLIGKYLKHTYAYGAQTQLGNWAIVKETHA